MTFESTVGCQSFKMNQSPYLIVLTGGPGAGKTAVLELARKYFCERIAVLPEAASIVFGGGFWRRESLAARKAAQRAIFHVQDELERIVKEEQWSPVGLCDRGTLDGLAYWPNSADSFFLELGITRESELKKYAAVIHLRTPSATQGYDHKNPVRIETASQAAAIDQNILEAWKGHPNRTIIDSSADFLAKATQAMNVIRKHLPDCCKAHEVPELNKSG